MTKKLLISLLTIIFALIIFNNSIFAYTQEEIEESKNKAEELLKAEINNSEEEIKNYYNSLMQTKETLNQMILETEEKDELQKLKYSINITIMQLEEVVKVNLLESEISKYIGYVPTLLGVNLDTSKSKVDVEVIPKYTGSKISGAIAFNGGGQYGTTLKNRAELFCQDHGGSLTSVSKSDANVDDGEDGTLYVTGNAGTFKFQFFTDYVGQRREKWEENLSGTFVQLDTRIRRDKYGFYALSERYHTLEPDSVISYGDWKCTRSIARFSASKADLKEGQSYILGHSQYNTGGYPSYVQQAYWLYQENSGETQTGIEAGGVLSNASGFAEDADGAGSSITNDARQLAAEAIKLEEERLTPLGTEVENTTNMEECTVVYNLDEHCWYAGPFTLSYERKTLKTIAGAISKVEQGQNEILENKIEGLVEYRGINDIKYYDERGNELQGVEFVIPNKQERQEGDEEYKFPYPEEEFYLKIPYEGNEEAEEFKEMEVQLFDMYSEGEGYDLDGTYYKLRWEGRKYAILCTDPGSCSRHEGEAVGHSISVGCDSSCSEDCSGGHTEPCSGYAKCYIHNGPVSISHLQRWDHYLAAADSLDGPFDAQDLFNVTEAKIGMLFVPATLSMEKTLTIRMGGTVYNDLHTGKETDQNGIKDANEQGIKGVKVTITPITEEGEARQTYTDENGKWSIPDAKVGKYDVEFEYDGQTYKTTKYLASGDLKNLNDSKAKEVEGERQAFNDKFYEITETLEGAGQLTTGTAVGTKGQRSGLNYATQNRVSKIITRDASTNIPLDLYRMQARTSSTDLYYPIDDLFHIEDYNKNAPGGSYTGTYPYLENINLGLIERAKADFAVNMDVFQAHVRLKDTFQVFTHNVRNIDSYEQMQNIENYVQKVNPDDYNWRWDDSLSSIYPDRESSELQVYIDYKIIIRNQSEIAKGQITELVNYYDNDVTYEKDTPVSNMASWAVIKQLNEVGQLEETRLELDWVNNSKYNKTKTYTQNGYTTMYTEGLKDVMLEPGQELEVHIIYRVKRDAQGPLIDTQEEKGKDNVIEINAYKTYVDGKVEGRIDTDSNPGNAIPSDVNTHEDDTEKAPYFKLVFDEAENVIEGNVWEDLRTETLENNQVIGNGVRETNEPAVGGVKVELIEIFTNEDTKEEIQRVIETKTSAYTSDGTVSDGGYRFENVPGGIYRIKFTYGLEEQLTKDIKYNGHDYKATVINGEIKQETTKKEAKAEIILTIDTSGSMSGIMNTVKSAAIQLVNDLFDNQEDLKIGVVQFVGSASVVCTPTSNRNTVIDAINSLRASGGTNIAAGIEKTMQTFSNETDKTKIMVLFTDGHSNATAAKNALINAADNQGVYPISVLTSNATNIFGTEENPTRGKTYLIKNSEIYNTFAEMVYGDIQDVTYITANRSYASDVEQVAEITVGQETRTREQNINYSSTMVNKNGTVLDAPREELASSRLDTAYIETLTGEEKQKAIKELAENTYITAVTDKIKVNPNNNSQTGQTSQNTQKVGSQFIRQVNLGLVERPKVKIETDEEIVGIQLILSDGTLLIDTENGLTNYVTAPNRKGVDKTISIDNELQQGSTIKIKYKITIKNTGEVDTYGSYFAYDIDDVDVNLIPEYKETISTSASIVYAYVNQNMAFRQEENNQWKVVTDTSILSQDVQTDIKAQKCTVIETTALSEPLYPEISKEVKSGQKPSSVETTLILSKVISSQDSTDTLTYNNSIEIVQRYNKVGRRDYIGVPGNYNPNSNIVEYDSAKAETVIIIPPFGEQRIYYMLTAIIISIIALSVLLIKKYIIGKKQN